MHTVFLMPVGVTWVLYAFIYYTPEGSVTEVVVVFLARIFTCLLVTIRLLPCLLILTNARFRHAMKDTMSKLQRKVTHVTKVHFAAAVVADQYQPPEIDIVASLGTDCLPPAIPSKSIHVPESSSANQNGLPPPVPSGPVQQSVSNSIHQNGLPTTVPSRSVHEPASSSVYQSGLPPTIPSRSVHEPVSNSVHHSGSHSRGGPFPFRHLDERRGGNTSVYGMEELM
jgi:hypothetical protein